MIQNIINQSIDSLLTPSEAADYLGIAVETLNVWRCTKRYDLSYIKVGRLVKYRQSALDAFLESRTQGSVSYEGTK